MPAKNVVKTYIKNGYYHLYNRGVEKRTIFVDSQDYNVFLNYLCDYLLPKDTQTLTKKLADPSTPWTDKDRCIKLLKLKNFSGDITLIAYALMPNHFHFVLKQKEQDTIDAFMNSLATRYAMYFNRKYRRVGPLFQGSYKGVAVTSDEQLLWLTSYVHRNHLSLQGVTLQTLSQQYSSYAEYIGLRKTSWIHSEETLGFFSKTNSSTSYASFVSQSDEPLLLSGLAIDSD